jgi:hypothetical protein
VGGHGIPWVFMVSKVFHRLALVGAKEFAGFVKHLMTRFRVTPSAICCVTEFMFRSCGQLCGQCAYARLPKDRLIDRGRLRRPVPSRAGGTRAFCRSSRSFARRGEVARQPVSRVLSTSCEAGRPFLWDAPCDAPLATNPSGGTGTSLRANPSQRPGSPRPLLFGLAPGGVYHAAPVARGAVRSYRTVSPLPAGPKALHGRFVFCGTFPGVAPAGR